MGRRGFAVHSPGSERCGHEHLREGSRAASQAQRQWQGVRRKVQSGKLRVVEGSVLSLQGNGCAFQVTDVLAFVVGYRRVYPEADARAAVEERKNEKRGQVGHI